jgi:hypothetical protein
MNEMARNQPEIPKSGETSDLKKKVRKNHEIDAQIEDSFPASDPPSYAGGAHAGAPAHRKNVPSKSHKRANN